MANRKNKRKKAYSSVRKDVKFLITQDEERGLYGRHSLRPEKGGWSNSEEIFLQEMRAARKGRF